MYITGKEFKAARNHILKVVDDTIEDTERLRCLIYDRAAFGRAMEVLTKLLDECRSRREEFLADEDPDTLGKMTNAMSQLLGAFQMCSTFLK